jgi:hypothetical protein
VTGRKKNAPRRKDGATSVAKPQATDREPIRLVFAEGGLEVLLEREKLALNAVRQESAPGGAAEALHFLASKAVRRKIQSYGGREAVKKALGTAIPFETWCARWQSVFETEVVRLVQQAAWAPRSVADLKRFPGGPRGDYQATHITKIAMKLGKAASSIRALDSDEYWAGVRSAGLAEALELYAERLLRTASTIMRIEKSPEFRSLAHKNEEWVLEQISSLAGQPYREKAAVIMRAVYSLAGHTPAEAETLRRWQRRQRTRQENSALN